MTATIAAPGGVRNRLQLRAIDTDLHHQSSNWSAVAPFVPEGLRWRVKAGGPPMARLGFKKVGVAFGAAPLPPAQNGKAPHPAADPRWV